MASDRRSSQSSTKKPGASSRFRFSATPCHQAHRKTYFTFTGDEIAVLYNFLRNIEVLPLRDDRSARLDDRFVTDLVLTRDQALRLLAEQPELVDELLRTRVTATEIAELGHRREQLSQFERMLREPAYFENKRVEQGRTAGAESRLGNASLSATLGFSAMG